MTYPYIYEQDGQVYLPGEEVPDLGSLRCVEKNGKVRSYEGLSKDKDKLPNYVATGSTCLMIDTSDFYKYEETTQTWYKL